MNQQMADKLGHYKRENKALKAKLHNYETLEKNCIEMQHELNKLRSQLRRIREVTKE